jgi:hypothetical protein
MKLPPFTLIYQSDPESGEERLRRTPGTKRGGAKKGSAKRGGAKARASTSKRDAALMDSVEAVATESSPSDERLSAIGQTAPDLARSLEALPARLSSTLLSSSFAQQALGTETDTAAEALRPILQDLQRSKTTVTVALWDIDARVGALPELISVLNQSQPVFTFFDLQAPIPSGLIIQAEHFGAWAQERLGRRVSKKEREEFQNNLMSNDFYKHASGVYKDLGVDYLVGLTQYMIAGEEEGQFFWSYFSASSPDNRVLLVSAYELRDYARRAGRPFEVAVGMLVIGQLLATINKKVDFHRIDTGCLFDFNDDRVSVIECIKRAEIEPSCMALIDAKYRAPAQAMMEALKDYRTAETSDEMQEDVAAMKIKPQTDSYWLKKLKSLSSELGKELDAETK